MQLIYTGNSIDGMIIEPKTIDDLSIELLQACEPPEGYYLGFSGGKDSVVIYDLAKRSGVKFEAVYNVSPIDPPQIHQFIKENYPEVRWEKHAQGFFGKHMLQNGLPLRTQRWCCRIIKECGGVGRVKILGMRIAESNRRSGYNCFMQHKKEPETRWVLPIVRWQDSDVWQYISENNLKVCSLYNEGFTRLGCVLCPNSKKDDVAVCLEKFPKIVNCWKQSADRYFNARLANPKRKHMDFKTSEEYFNWWISR